jgi:hypothetical protein
MKAKKWAIMIIKKLKHLVGDAVCCCEVELKDGGEEEEDEYEIAHAKKCVLHT